MSTGFAAIPGDERVDGEFVAPARMDRRERVEHGRLRLFQFRDRQLVGVTARFSILLGTIESGSFQPPLQFSPPRVRPELAGQSAIQDD